MLHLRPQAEPGEIYPVQGIYRLDPDLKLCLFTQSEIFGQAEIKFLKGLISQIIKRVPYQSQCINARAYKSSSYKNEFFSL